MQTQVDPNIVPLMCSMPTANLFCQFSNGLVGSDCLLFVLFFAIFFVQHQVLADREPRRLVSTANKQRTNKWAWSSSDLKHSPVFERGSGGTEEHHNVHAAGLQPRSAVDIAKPATISVSSSLQRGRGGSCRRRHPKPRSRQRPKRWLLDLPPHEKVGR